MIVALDKNAERIINDPAAWSARVDSKYRLSFEPPSGASILLLHLLNHDDLYKHPR